MDGNGGGGCGCGVVSAVGCAFCNVYLGLGMVSSVV